MTTTTRPLLVLVLLAGLIALAPSAARAQSADDEIREYDLIYVKGSPTPMKGTIIEKDARRIRVRRPNSTSTFEIDVADVVRIEERLTAEDVYEKRTARLGSGDVDGRLALARWCLEKDLDQPAEKEARLVLKTDPGQVDAYHVLLDVYAMRLARVAPAFHEQLTDEELAAIYAAQDRGVESARLSLAAGQALLRSGLPDLAAPQLRAARDALAAAGDDADRLRRARIDLGEALLRSGEATEADAVFTEVLEGPEADPTDLEALFGRGRARCSRGALDEAATDLEAAVTADPENALAQVAQGIVHYLRGDGTLAFTALQAALKLGLDPEREREARWHLGLSYLRLGRYRSAKTEFVALLEKDADDPLGRTGLALVHAGRDEDEAAVEQLKKAADRDRLGGNVVYLQALLLHRLGRNDEALSALRDAMRAGFDFDSCARAMCEIEEATGDMEGVARFGAYLTSRPQADADDWYVFGRALLATDRREEARRALDKALELQPDHAPALAARAYAAYEAGDRTAADADFRRALAADPGLAYARRGIEYLIEARTRRVWTDTFERTDDGDVRNRWSEDERFGVDVRIVGKRAVFSGTQANKDNGRTRLVRTIVGTPVAEFNAALDVSAVGDARVGLRIETNREGTVVLFRSADGKLEMAYRTGAGQFAETTIDCGTLPDDGRPHRIALEIDDPIAGKVVATVDEQVRGECTIPNIAKAREYNLVIYGQAPLGTEWKLGVEEVSVFIQQKQGAPTAAPGGGSPSTPATPGGNDQDEF